MQSLPSELDLIEELKLRRWARENYLPSTERRAEWHPVIHEEMVKKDQELVQTEPLYA